MRQRVVWDERDVRTAEHDRNAALAVVTCKFVGAVGSSGNNGHADDVDIEVRRNVFDAFVEQLQFVFDVVGDQRGQRRQRQGRVA